MAEGAGAAANLIPADVDAVLTLCGFTNDNDRRKFWLVEGWSETADFGMFSYKEIKAMASRAERRPTAQRVIVGAVKLKKLKAISYWVRKLSNQGNDDPDINTLDNVTLHDLVVEMNVKEEDKERDSLDLKPKDFDAKDFDDWSKSFIVYLDSIAGGAGTPLSYVVRSEDADPDDATNTHDWQIWSARLDGPIFEKDNLVVHRALHNLLLSTSGFPWFEQAPDGDGRAAFKALTDHYKGPAHQNLLAAEADAILETLHWKNEFVCPFDTYLTNLTKVFKSKQDANEEVPETMKVKEMLKRMKTDIPAVLASMALVRLKHPDNFKSAGEEMATQIAQIFPRSKHEREKSGYTRNRKVAAMERDGK